MVKNEVQVEGFLMKECGYKTDNIPPMPDESWKAFGKGDRWGNEIDSHCWF